MFNANCACTIFTFAKTILQGSGSRDRLPAGPAVCSGILRRAGSAGKRRLMPTGVWSQQVERYIMNTLCAIKFTESKIGYFPGLAGYLTTLLKIKKNLGVGERGYKNHSSPLAGYSIVQIHAMKFFGVLWKASGTSFGCCRQQNTEPAPKKYYLVEEAARYLLGQP